MGFCGSVTLWGLFEAPWSLYAFRTTELTVLLTPFIPLHDLVLQDVPELLDVRGGEEGHYVELARNLVQLLQVLELIRDCTTSSIRDDSTKMSTNARNRAKPLYTPGPDLLQPSHSWQVRPDPHLRRSRSPSGRHTRPQYPGRPRPLPRVGAAAARVTVLDPAVPTSPTTTTPAVRTTPADLHDYQLTTIGGLADFHFYPVIIHGNVATITPTITSWATTTRTSCRSIQAF